MLKVFKEIMFFIVLFLFLTLGMHMEQWFSHPLEHLEHLSSSKFGLLHPITFTALIYIVLYIIRAILDSIKNLFVRKA